MAVPPPPPPPDPPSTDPLPHPTSFPSSKPQASPSDLVRSGPDLVALSASAGQPSSGHVAPSQPPCQQASAPLAASPVEHPGSSSGISGQPLNIFPATRASDIAAAGPNLAAAGPSSGHLNSAQALPLQPTSHQASSSLSPSNSGLPHPQIASVLPLLASVLQPTATSFPIPSSSSPPLSSQTATLQPSCLGSSMVCPNVSLDPPPCYAAAQNPVPIGSTPCVRFNASTKHNSANPLPLPPLLHPPPPPSYAQAAKLSRGSGFVRSHAVDVESFARLPRTGAKIICGSREGIPSFSFVNSDLQTVEHLYANALIMKFYGGRPSLEVSHREIQSWGLEHPFSIGPLSSRAFLLRFQDNQDLIRVLTRPSSILITSPYKVFRWHNLCHLKDDSCYAPVWISLPKLPLQCFIPEFLESVANRIGRFLCFDKATTTLARPSAARLCVELDLRTTPPPFIWVGLFDGLKQPIIYEKMPKYCVECHIQGHLATTCPKGQRETPNVQALPRSVMKRARPPPARQNAVKRFSVPLHQPITLAAPSSSSQPPTPPNHPSTSAPSPSPLLNAEAPRPQPLAAAHTSVPSSPLHLDSDEARHQHTTLQQPSLLQAQPTVSLLQQAPDATISAEDHLQAQQTAALLQQAPQQSAGLLQQTAAAAGPAVHAQPSASLQQEDPAAAPPPAGLDPLLLAAAYTTVSPSSYLPADDAVRHHPHPPSQLSGSSLLQPSSAAAGPSDVLIQAQQSAALLQQPTAAAGPSDVPAQLSSALLQREPSAAAPSAVFESAATSSPPATSAISAHANDRMIPSATQSSKSLKGKYKSINSQPSVIGISASLPQQQRAALEKFKSTLHPSQIGGHHLSSVNHFEALRYDHSDVDGDGDVASYYSDTDDGGAEHIELGYQSANGRSSNKLKEFPPSGMRINKRHPNMPLRVKLRSRKDSHPSTP